MRSGLGHARRMRRRRAVPAQHRRRAQPAAARPGEEPDPHSGRCQGRGLAAGHSAQGTRGVPRHGARHRPGPPALGVRAAQRRRACGREQRATQTRRIQGHQGPGDEAADAQGGRRRDQRQPHHAAARRRWRWRGRNAQRASWTALNSPFGMALVGDELSIANADAVGERAYRAARRRSRGARRATDPPGGTRNHHWTKNIIASPDGSQALRDRRLQQQCRRQRHGRGRRPRRDLGDRPRDGREAPVRDRPAQSERPGLGAAGTGAVDGGERARRTGQRPRARLPHVGEGGRVLRLAVELLGRGTSTRG